MANSKVGFHVGPGGNKTGLGNWEQNAINKNIAFGLKAVDEYGPLFEAVNKGGKSWLGFRYTKASGKVTREVPNYHLEPMQDARNLAQQVVANLPPEFDKSVWIELINEPRAENKPGDVMYQGMNACEYLGLWCLGAAQYLNDSGYRFCGPSFNSGEPGRDGHGLGDAVEQWKQLEPYLRYCADNPDMAAVSVHEYSWRRWLDGETVSDWYPFLWGRFEAAIAAADLLNIPRTFSIFVTEFGFDIFNAPTYPAVTTYLDGYNQIVARFPQVKFAASWTLQGGYSPVDNQVQSWMMYPIDKTFFEGEQPAITHAVFGSTLPDETGETTMQYSFESNNWTVLSDRLQQPLNMILSVIAPGAPLWYSGGDTGGKATGTVEALHKGCNFVPPNLPPNQCADGSDPLVLDGFRCYKIQAVDMASGTSLKYTFPGTGRKRVTVPVNVHWQGDLPNEHDDVFVAVLMNGQLVKLLQHPELKDRTWHYVVGEADGPVEVELRFQTSYRNRRDLFTDFWTAEEIETMPDCNGLPRVQYTRRYNVIPENATEEQATAIFLEGWRRTRETTGGSYDDAGIGDLNNRIVNLYGIDANQKQVFIDWYNANYPGANINFLPLPGDNPDNPF